jgi:ribonuclease R
MKRFGREQVLAALEAGGGRSLHVMEIVQLLGAPKSAKDEVREILDELRALGLARELPGNRFRTGLGRRRAAPAPPDPTSLPGGAPASGSTRAHPRDEAERTSFGRRASAADAVTGWLSLTSRGFGFVTADDGGPDIFVAARGIGPAMHGDRVEVWVRNSPQGREGDVVRVLERGLTRVAGVLRREGRGHVLETQDARLPPTFRIVGALPLGTRPGMDVVAQITRWSDESGRIPEARVLRVLGPRGAAEVEIAKILVREGVIEEFPADVEQEALGFPPEVSEHDLRDREDLRALEFVTIDPEDARDHDDAVWAERLGDGSFRVIVAIADVSHYVREHSAIDREALARGCSIYLPGRAIPMLPPELSTHLASLVPDEDRLTLAVEARISKDGRVRQHRLMEAVIRSRARLTYGGVARALGLTDAAVRQPEAESRLPLLNTLHAVSRALRAHRGKRGVLEFELPEAKVVLDPRGEPMDVVCSRSDPGIKTAYGIVEDLMLLANEIVAAHLTRRELPTIYRVHGKPDPRRIEVFSAVAGAFGHVLPEGAAESPKKLQRFLEKVEGSPYAQSLSYLLLRAMQQATYDVVNVGHFALAAREYLHFTSPIRRYPDLAVHRVVRMLIGGERIDVDELRAKLRTQAIQSSRMERRAMTVEREAVNLYRCLLMKERIGEELEGTVTGVNEGGLWVTADRPFVEMRVPIERLGEDHYQLDRLGIRLVGRRSGRSFALGDRLRVRLEGIVIERRELVAVPVTRPEGRRWAREGRVSERSTRSGGVRPPSGRPAVGGSTPAARGRGARWSSRGTGEGGSGRRRR